MKVFGTNNLRKYYFYVGGIKYKRSSASKIHRSIASYEHHLSPWLGSFRLVSPRLTSSRPVSPQLFESSDTPDTSDTTREEGDITGGDTEGVEIVGQ
ncbi:hypothetical protein Glove_102g63 [Diversispora epigaea]|uniref:Uncharacterized protein n=1 Tax=Diversispora epigaea TaxID=1348612 RepID=A0A397J3R3_9GLOM|nr:hypothetical protein Glove_102g63 [Diversispora epigaea]